MLRPVLVPALVLACVAAPAVAAPRARTATARYTTPGGASPFLRGDSNVNGTRYGSATVFTRAGERRIEVTAADDAGLPVLFQITQDTDGNGDTDWWGPEFCGRTSEPVRIKAQRRDVFVMITAGQCGGRVSAPTTGTVTARLS